MTVQVAPSLLSANFARLAEEVTDVEQGGADLLHLDIMDGHFVPNISFGPHVVSVCNKITDLPLDVHLMISDPDKYIKDFSDSGADYISVHIENNPNIHRTLQNISSNGKYAGIVVNPGTPIESVFPVLHMVDYVLLMSVNPGFGGQVFLPETLLKIKKMSDELKNRNLEIPIEVDGGLNKETAEDVKKAGANIIVAGSFIFKNNPNGIQEAVKALKND